jgi:hypothetical protein
MLWRVRRTGGARSALRRAVRWAGIDGNPLRRGVDRVERAMFVLLAIAFAVAVPLLVPLAGRAAWTSSIRLVRAEQSWRQVDAVLQTRTPARSQGYDTAATLWEPARWRAPSGAMRSGLVPVEPGTPAGATTMIWVTESGRYTGIAPLTTGLITFRVVTIEVIAASGLAALALLLGVAVRWAGNRRRMAYWAIEWACFGPRWSARHRPRLCRFLFARCPSAPRRAFRGVLLDRCWP